MEAEPGRGPRIQTLQGIREGIPKGAGDTGTGTDPPVFTVERE